MDIPETQELDKTNEESVFNGRYLRTYTGLYIDVFDPKPEMICEEDIIHGLSNMPRWAGQTKEFYSVAQHSRLVSIIVNDEHKWAALWHDASEAYMLDMPRPLKRELPQYKEVENNLMRVIAEKFGFEYPMHPTVKEADNIVLEVEHQILMHGKSSYNDWYISPLQPRDAKKQLVERVREVKRLLKLD